MPLVINSANGKTMFRDVDSSKLDEPARLAGEAMDDADNTDDGLSAGKWDPPLGKELKATRVGNKLRAVRDGVTGIEIFRTQRTKGAFLVSLRHRMHHCVLPEPRVKRRQSLEQKQKGVTLPNPVSVIKVFIQYNQQHC